MHFLRLLHMISSFHLPKHCHLIAGEFGIVSNEMKTSPICLGDYEAIERVAMESGKQRQRENAVGSNTSPFCCCWSRSTSASGRRRASLPSRISICSSQTLARLKCKLFAGEWHASSTAPDSFDSVKDHVTRPGRPKYWIEKSLGKLKVERVGHELAGADAPRKRAIGKVCWTTKSKLCSTAG
jgi:hypothetical protein